MNDFAEAPAAPEPVADTQPAETSQPSEEKGANDEEAPQSRQDRQRGRRASLEKAFKEVGEKAEAEDGEKAKAVKPRNGSPTAPQSSDAKAEGDQKAQSGAEKAQGEAKAGAEGKDGQKAGAKPEGAQTSANSNAAPERFSADAKAEWERAPESVRAEANRAIREMEKGIKQKDDVLKPLEPYLKEAAEHKTNLAEVVGRYRNLEKMLHNPQTRLQGMSVLAQNMGMTPQQLGRALLGQQPGQPDQRDQELMQLRQEVQRLNQGFGQMTQAQQQQRENALYGEIEAFANQNPRFDDLADEIARLLQTGYAEDLQDAYEKAERLNPAPAQQGDGLASAQPAQTRQARSVTGAPTAGSNPGNRKPSANRQEALAKAMRQAGF